MRVVAVVILRGVVSKAARETVLSAAVVLAGLVAVVSEALAAVA